MGHGSSKELPETTNTEGASTPSSRIKRPHIRRIFRRIFRRLTISRGNGSSSSSTLKLVSAEGFAGIALLTLISADMQQFKDKWLACVSFGEQTFRTHISDQLT
jgi:phosphatidylserine decarboxylase